MQSTRFRFVGLDLGLRPLGLALVLASVPAGPAVGGPAPRGPVSRREDPPDRIEELWRAEVIEHGDVDQCLDELSAIAQDESAGVEARLEALGTAIALLRRQGDFDRARSLCELQITLRGTPEDRLLRASMLDATGEARAARDAYLEVADELRDPAAAQRARLRSALLSLELGDEGSAAALAEIAAEDRGEFRNRAAVVLALLEDPGQALQLFQIEGEGSERFRREVRVAEWAIRAEDWQRAQDSAWSAMEAATLGRDRDYALAVLVEACRASDALPALIDRIAALPEPSPELRSLWIELLRETGRIDEAIALFRSSNEGAFTVEMRRDLLDLYREAERDEQMVSEYRRLIEAQPRVVEWAEGLCRYFLESGETEQARAVWDPVLQGQRDFALLPSARALAGLGQDDLALACVERCVQIDREPVAALLEAFKLHHQRGRGEEAAQVLRRIDALAAPEAAERYALSEAWEQLGEHAEAVRALEGVVQARGAEAAGEDTAMRLAWLYSEMGDEDRALEAWRALWQRVQSIPRRRYVEDRMMTVASRLGKLADLAIELEERLLEGRAEQKDTGLLVRLYSKVQDAVSAAEVIDEFLERSGGDAREALQEKARVYLSCTDYYNYERTVRELIEVDPEGEPDYLRQLAMSQLERGRPDQAREVLARLGPLEGGSEGSEFEAGVLALAGMREEAIVAYRRGIARFPDRIESYLLMSALMQEAGQAERAVGMFQYLAETADRDDLFTIAIDGLLNLEAPVRVLEWARRITLERLAGRHDKPYLYQLLSDLAEQVEDRGGMLVALENSLAIAGSRRSSVLRELMDLSGSTSAAIGAAPMDRERHLAYGRRLIALSDIVPPQVYLDLGRAFLASDDVRSAAKTFALARDLPDWQQFQRQTAQLFEEAGFVRQALKTYEHVLVSRSLDVGLMAKIAELHEQMGRDEVAQRLDRQGVNLLLTRQPLDAQTDEQPESKDPFLRYYGAQNLNEFDQHFDRLLTGFLVTADEASARAFAQQQRAALDQDLAALKAGEDDRLRRHPRLLHRADLLRRLAGAFDLATMADEVDRSLLAAFPDDAGLLEELVRERCAAGLYASARSLIADSERPEDQREALRYLVGEGSGPAVGESVSLSEAVRLLLPLLAADRRESARDLLRSVEYRVESEADLQSLPALFSAARWLGDPDSLLRTARQWVRMLVDAKTASYQMESVFRKCASALPSEHHRSLCQYFVGLVLEDTAERSQYLTLLPTLQEPFEEALVTPDQLFEVLEDYGQGALWGLAPVLQLLPTEDRGAALRSIWPKVQKTQRASSLLQLIYEFQEDMGPELADFVIGSLGSSLGEADDFYKYRVRSLWTSATNREVALRAVVPLREADPEDWKVDALEVLCLQSLGREQEALDKLPGMIDRMVRGPQNYEQTQVRNLIRERFVPQRRDEILGILDQVELDHGSSVELAQFRVELFDRQSEAEAYGETLRQMLQSYPTSVPLLQLGRSFASLQGRQVESLEFLERLIEEEPGNRRHAVQLVQGWLRLDHPLNALAAKERHEVSDEELRGGGSGVRTVISASGVRMQVGGATGGSKVEGKIEPASVPAIKQAMEAGEIERARRLLRRQWRQFPIGGKSARTIVFVNRSAPLLAWPEEEKAEDEGKEQPARRGGLESFVEEEPERPEPLGAYEVLAREDFGLSELQRMLRSASPSALASMQPALEGMRKGLEAREGEAFVQRLLDAVAEGRAGRGEALMLLGALDQRGERGQEVPSGAEAVLTTLLRNVDPQDGVQLQRLSRVFARLGASEVAERLFRWCATQVRSDRFYSPFSNPNASTVDSLVKDVRESLEGERRLAVVDTILEVADPGNDEYGSRQSWEVLALETWLDLLGPAEALSRGTKICEGVLDLPRGLRRQTAPLAALLYAHAGEHDKALRCLEIALCTFDRAQFDEQGPYLWFRPEYPGYLSHQHLRRLFPRDTASMNGAAEWMIAAAQAMDVWMDQGRTNPSAPITAQALIVRRLVTLGRREEAAAVCASMRARCDQLSSSMQLYVVDAYRELGDTASADALEAVLLEEGSLRTDRVAEALDALAAREGTGPALELALQWSQTCLREDLLQRLQAWSTEQGDAAAAERWREKAAEAAEAREILEAAQEP